MRVSYILCILLIASSCKRTEKEKYSSNFNYGAIEGYFRLIDSLQVHTELSNTEWNHFLNIEANRWYIDENNISNKTLRILKENIEQAYASKTTVAPEDIFFKIRKLYAENDSVYRKHLQFIKSNEATIIDSMIERTKRFLPSNRLQNSRIPNIYYHALDHDGSANSKGIFISIMAAYENNSRRLANYESHEFHHLQRPNILDELKIDDNDTGIIWALNAILNEGLADMVDKDVMLSDTSDWWLKELVKDFYIKNAPNVIIEFDAMIQHEASGKQYSQEDYQDVFIGTVGHTPGYWMATAISMNGNSKRMIDNANDPFTFFMLYNEIAVSRPEKLVAFSQTSMDYITKIASKYKSL